MKKTLLSIFVQGLLCLLTLTTFAQTADFIAVGGNDHYAADPSWNCNDFIRMYSKFNAGTHTWTLPAGCSFSFGSTASSPDIAVTLSPRVTGSYTISHSVVFGGTTYTSSQTFDLDPSIGTNTITAPSPASFSTPSDPAIITGNTVTGAFYQWYKKSAHDLTFVMIDGATNADYDPAYVSVTTSFYRKATLPYLGCNCSSFNTSNTVTITITNGSPCVCAGSNTITRTTGIYDVTASSINPTVINGSVPVVSSGSFTYQWQKKSASTGNVFVDIAGANGQNYDPPTITENTTFRRKVISGACISYSNEDFYAIGQGTEGLIAPGNKPSYDKAQELVFESAFLNNPYPNPATGDITISCSLKNEQSGVLRIIDIQGKLILERPIAGSLPVLLSKEHFAAGVYNCLLIVNEEIIDSKKFSVIK